MDVFIFFADDNTGGEEEESHGGMPYSYNYDATLSSKKETADDQGNVEGSYTYIDGAGKTRTVSYTVKGIIPTIFKCVHDTR